MAGHDVGPPASLLQGGPLASHLQRVPSDESAPGEGQPAGFPLAKGLPSLVKPFLRVAFTKWLAGRLTPVKSDSRRVSPFVWWTLGGFAPCVATRPALAVPRHSLRKTLGTA